MIIDVRHCFSECELEYIYGCAHARICPTDLRGKELRRTYVLCRAWCSIYIPGEKVKSVEIPVLVINAYELEVIIAS